MRFRTIVGGLHLCHATDEEIERTGEFFGHFNIIRLSRRPFRTVEEMDETMVERWNAKVRDDDTVT